jgi:hypothetical protein
MTPAHLIRLLLSAIADEKSLEAQSEERRVVVRALIEGREARGH